MERSELSGEHYAALGRIADASSLLETSLKVSLSELINPENIHLGLVLLVNLNIGALIDRYKLVLKHIIVNDDGLDPFYSSLNKISRFIGERNTFIHSFWATDPDDKVFKRTKLVLDDGKIDLSITDIKSITPERLNKLASDIHAENKIFRGLMDDLIKIIYPRHLELTPKEEPKKEPPPF